jgi:hypothetical protein
LKILHATASKKIVLTNETTFDTFVIPMEPPGGDEATNSAAVADFLTILEEHMIISEIDLDLLSVSRSRAPLLGDLRTRWAALQRIISRD